MAKGYWIARLDITDQQAYDSYRALNSIAFAKFGGRFLVRGGPFERVRGSSRVHNVVVEFGSLEAAQTCYASPEYKAAYVHLEKAGQVDLVIIGGYDGPQPA
jgi:uncharacterized protein (DUF1330 family)